MYIIYTYASLKYHAPDTVNTSYGVWVSMEGILDEV